MNPKDQAPDAYHFLRVLFEATAPYGGDNFLRVVCKEWTALFSAEVAFFAQLSDELGLAKILAAWPLQWAGQSYDFAHFIDLQRRNNG